MSKRFNNGSHYENHQRAAELRLPRKQISLGSRAHVAALGREVQLRATTWPPTRIAPPRCTTAKRITSPDRSIPGLAREHSDGAFEHSQNVQQKAMHATGAGALALEHYQKAFLDTEQLHRKAGNAQRHSELGHEGTATLGYALWKARGCPDGSPNGDWFYAKEQLCSSQAAG